MNLKKISLFKSVLSLALLYPFILVNAENYNAPIIQPGAPGNPSKVLEAEDATNISNTSYIKADVEFLKGMIVHHKQAILMSNMAAERTNNKTIIDLAKRIDASQEDEINFMESWLKQRNEFSDNTHNNHHMHGSHHMINSHEMHLDMAGMATPKQLDDLKNQAVQILIDYSFS